MEVQEYLDLIGINKTVELGDNNSYIVTIIDSDEFGKIFSLLENESDLETLEENQIVTITGSSLLYESKSQPYILNLLADFENEIYQLIINQI